VLAAALCALAAAAAAPALARSTDPLIADSTCADADRADLDAGRAATAIRCLTNAARANAGVRVLAANRRLSAIARKRRRLMLRCNAFSHSPCGHDLGEDARPYGRSARSWSAAENIQYRTRGAHTPRRVVDNWLASPGHRRNLLSSRWRHQAVAVAGHARFRGSRAAWLWVQDFGYREG